MKSYRIQIFTLALMSFILGCSEFMVVGILTDLSRGLHISVVQAGHLVTIFALVYAVATPLVTIALGKCSQYRSLLALTAIFVLGNLLSFFSQGYLLFLISRIITAIVSGPMISLGLAIANMISPPEKRPQMVSLVFSGFSIASVFGVPIGAWISVKFGWIFSFLAVALLSVGVLVLILLTLPKSSVQKPVGVRDSLSILKDARIRVGVLLPLFSAGGFYVFYTYLNPILLNLLHYPAASVSGFLFAFGVTSIFSNLLSGVIAGKSGMKKMYLIFLVQAALFFLLFAFAQSKIIGSAIILILGISMYLLNSPIQVHFFSIAERDYPQSVVFVCSLNSIFFNFGISMGSFLGSAIVDRVGLPYVDIGAGILIAVAVLLSLLLNQLDARSSRARKELQP